MRERGGLSVMAVVVVVMVLVVAKVTVATPAAATRPHHHQEPSEGPTSTSTSMAANHVEDEYLDDALDTWLNNFDTYTFMVKQDLVTHEEEGGEGQDQEEVEVEEEEEEGEKEEPWSAPIAVSVGSKSLLNPHLDYLVTVESLVAEEGSIFLTLSKYNNQTECGVGGLTVEAVMRSIPQRPTGGGGGSPAHQSEGHSGGLPAGNSSFPALIAFGLQNEGNITLPDTSAWAEVSEDYWWARGRLAGGGMLSITYTPPECGCLSLSTYYALPVGNLTLVVGPQAYPDELQILLCMDPLPETPALDEYEDEEEEEEDVGEYIQEPSALVAPKTTGETDTEAEVVEVPNEHPPVTPRKKKPRVGGRKRKTKKTRRQMKRQRIRQAGRRQARRQQRQEMRQEDEEEEGEEGEDARRGGGFKRAQRRWKQKRKGRKAWRKLKKNSRRGRRRFHGARQHHGHHEEMNGTSEENMTDHHHHHHHPHHFLLGQNASEAIQQEERLIDVLLRDEPENSTMEQQQEGEEEEGVEGSSVTEEEGGGGEEEEVETPRQRRKNRRQRKKMMRKERRKPHYPPGVKFCCKQGVKHKKNILEFNTTSENSPGPCNATSELVSNFANHQFDIEVEVCDATYSKCCFKFTADMWNAIKSRKMARRRERKERRKSRRLDRKHRRQNERRMRKEMMRQSRHQHLHVTEGPKEEDPGRQGEGDAALE